MAFYKNSLGRELFLQTLGESLIADSMPSGMKDAILHSMLTHDELDIMGSDVKVSQRVEGSAVHICVNCRTDEEINTFFDRLSAGGEIIQKVTDMPWGAKFGAVIDKYGKHWMFSYDKNQYSHN